MLQACIDRNQSTYQFDYINTNSLSAVTAAQRYTDIFFIDYRLAILYLPANSGSIRYEVTSVESADDVTVITLRAKILEIGTDDMADWFIFVPVEAAHAHTVHAVPEANRSR